jgi:serine/threonine-protein kinase
MVDNIVPEMVGRYKVIDELGRGGMAAVYKALDPNFDREVAVKVLPRALLHDPKFRTRFEREGKMIARLEHNAIVPVYDFGEQDGQPYIVMRLMTGGSLSLKINDHAPFSLKETSRILNRMAGGLDVAHSKGVIHRDMKPGNVLFDDYGDAYLSDFGIARLVGSDATLTGSGIIGTPAYMSPEQIQGERDIDGRTDIYSLGVILYLMLSDEMPYDADTPGKVMMQHVLDPVPILSIKMADIPKQVSAVIAKAMAKDPNDRYQTGMEMAEDFAKAVDYGTMHVSNFDFDVEADLDELPATRINLPNVTKSTAPTTRLPTSGTSKPLTTPSASTEMATSRQQSEEEQKAEAKEAGLSSASIGASASNATNTAAESTGNSQIMQASVVEDVIEDVIWDGINQEQDLVAEKQPVARKPNIWVWIIATVVLLVVAIGAFMIFWGPDSRSAGSNVQTNSEPLAAAFSPTDTQAPTETLMEAFPTEAKPTLEPTATDIDPTATYVPTATEVQPTATYEPTATQVAGAFSDEQWDEFLSNANIMIYEEISTELFPYIQNTLKTFPSNVVWNGNAFGKTVNDISSGPEGGKVWDLAIFAFENRYRSSGELFPYIKAAIDNGSSVIIEAWQLDHTTQESLDEILQLCGVEVEEYLPRRQGYQDLFVYPIIGADHPILSDPNFGFSFTNVDTRWISSNDLGDLMSLTGEGDAELLIGIDATESSRDGVLANCLDGRLTLMTFSSHTYPYDVMSPLWENMAYYGLKSRLRYLNQQ